VGLGKARNGFETQKKELILAPFFNVFSYLDKKGHYFYLISTQKNTLKRWYIWFLHKKNLQMIP